LPFVCLLSEISLSIRALITRAIASLHMTGHQAITASTRTSHVARKFLYLIAVCIALFIGVRLIWEQYGAQLIKRWLVPKVEYVAPKPVAANAYTNPNMWFARAGQANSPAAWVPKGTVKLEARGDVATFFIHPTSYITSKSWNAEVDHAESRDRASLFVKGQASVFNAVGDVWAPKYRQAAFGAFLTDKPEGQKAIDSAYADVALAFDQFVTEAGGRPIILAGHSQGSAHLLRLLKEKVASKPIAKQIIAAYAIGWPISISADLPALGLPACTSATQRGCIVSFESFGEPADLTDVMENYDRSTGMTGKPRKGTPILCTNPLLGQTGGSAPASANLGTLKNKDDFSDGELVASLVPARCSDQGVLLIGQGPNMGPYELPGRNYHVYDYSLFWANLRADALRRAAIG
jgi:Protein of unknown function (DUF3089)